MSEAVRIVPLFIRWLDFDAARRVRQARCLDPAAWRVIHEDCLRPWLLTGDSVMIDRERMPRDADLVLVAMRYRRSGMIGGDFAVKTCESIKQFRIVDGEPYLCAADGSVSADPHEILGVVVAWHRRQWWRRPSPRKMRFPGPASAETSAASASAA